MMTKIAPLAQLFVLGGLPRRSGAGVVSSVFGTFSPERRYGEQDQPERPLTFSDGDDWAFIQPIYEECWGR
jgi:hypothetical protein